MQPDALLPAAPALLSEEAKEILGAAVSFDGGTLRSAEATQVQYRPGRSLAVLYEAKVARPGKSVRRETLVAMTSVDGAPEGSLPIRTDELEVGVWRLAYDPMLPGLRTALSKESASRFLGPQPGPVGISLRSYRPTRRAVVRLSGRIERYVKVVRPGQAAPLAEIHERLRPLVPAPEVVTCDDAQGLLCLEALPGRPMVEALAKRDPLPDAPALLSILERLGRAPAGGRRRRSPRQDVRSHATFLATVVPEQAERVEAIVRRIGSDPERSTTTIHGDFYEAQLLVGDDGGITGVLDLDRAGTGHPSDDLATMLAHLDALALYRPPLARRCTTYRDQLWPAFAAAAGDADDLRGRVAAVAVGLATGPYRLRHPAWPEETLRYLQVAERWLDERPCTQSPTATTEGTST